MFEKFCEKTDKKYNFEKNENVNDHKISNNFYM